MERTAVMKRRLGSMSCAGPEWDSIAAIPGQGRVWAEQPPRRGESRDRR